jgi:hypothetical protein
MMQVTGKVMVLGIPPGFLEDLKWLLSTAYQQLLLVSPQQPFVNCQ